MRSSLISRLAARRPAVAQRRSVRLCLELLEDRSLLSAGAFDLSFGQNGVATAEQNAMPVAVAVDGDGKIVLLDQTQTGYDVLRFNADGSLDSSFGSQGMITARFGDGASVLNLVLLPDGQIVVGGGHTSNHQTFLDVARFNSDGSADSTFGTDGLAELTPGGGTDSSTTFIPTDMAVQGNGDIVVAGTFGSALAVVRLNNDGSLDTNFGAAGMTTTTIGDGAQAGGLALQADGRIVVTGGVSSQLDVVCYNTDGSLDSTFGAGGIVTATLSGTTFENSRAAIEAGNGQLLVAANSFSETGSDTLYAYGVDYLDLFRFHSDGSADSGFGTGGRISSSNWNGWYDAHPTVQSNLALQDDGKILVGSNSWGESLVTRYNADGTVDLTYGIGGTTYVSYGGWNANSSTSLSLQGDGKLVVASTNSQWNDGVFQTSAILTRLQADGDLRPTQFGSGEAFRQYLIYQAVKRYSYLFGTLYHPAFYGSVACCILRAQNDAPTLAATDGVSYSQTNTQVAGVDEGDTVKTDGQYLYVLSGGNLVILNAWPADSLATLSVTSLTGNPLVEYLNGNRLTVISQTYAADNTPFEGVADVVPIWWNWRYLGHPVVNVTVYDVSDPTTPTVVQQTTLDGSYNSSRAIGNTLYVALDNTLSSLPPPIYSADGDRFVYESEADYVARIEALPLDYLLPQYSSSWTDANGSNSSSGSLTSAADIYQPAVPNDDNLMSLVAIDTGATDPGTPHSVSFLTSYGATLYAAPDNFYLITNRWSYSGEWTLIDKLSLQNSDITLAATGRVPGGIENPFSVSEDGAYLDIATTIGWGQNASNSVYVLAQDDQTLDVVGKLEDLAPGEVIYSVRFMGDRAFVSTFNRVDPLFAIDLSNPTDPIVAGKLDVSGYSDYLQPIDAHHLIGIGEEQDPVTGRVSDLAISLYNVSDLNNPKLLSRYVVATDGWSYSQGEYDYHAITYYPEYNALALPMDGDSSVPTPDGTGTQWVYQSGLLVFHVDASSGALNLLGEVHDVSPIHRSVFIGNKVYAISDTSVQAAALANPGTTIAQVQLPPPVYPYWWRGWEGGWSQPQILRLPPVHLVVEVPPAKATTTPVHPHRGTTPPSSHPSSPGPASTRKAPTTVVERHPGQPQAHVSVTDTSLVSAALGSQNVDPANPGVAVEFSPGSLPAGSKVSSPVAVTAPSTNSQQPRVCATGANVRRRRSAVTLDDSANPDTA
jgi:uncharacterized delta-60 repeat protein